MNADNRGFHLTDSVFYQSGIKILNSCISAWKSIVHNPRKFMAVVALLFAFSFFMGIVLSSFYHKIFQYLSAAGSVMISAQGIVSSLPSFDAIFFNAKTVPYLLPILFLITIFAFCSYYVIGFFLSIIVYFIRRYLSFADLRSPFSHVSTSPTLAGMLSVMKHTFFVFIPWTIIWFIREAVSFYVRLSATANTTLGNPTSYGYYDLFDMVLIAVIIYYALVAVFSDKKFIGSILFATRSLSLVLLYVLFILGFVILNFFFVTSIILLSKYSGFSSVAQLYVFFFCLFIIIPCIGYFFLVLHQLITSEQK